VAQSTIARESDVPLPTFAGPEIGVASTKAFTCQLAVLASLAIAAGRARGTLSRDDETRLVNALAQVPRHMSSILAGEKAIAGARRLAQGATCSTWAAASTIRWRSKARSSSRKSPTSTPKAMPRANSSTGPSR
jgi:fructoselysine-6-P-deglycase FrlB-like protein